MLRVINDNKYPTSKKNPSVKEILGSLFCGYGAFVQSSVVVSVENSLYQCPWGSALPHKHDLNGGEFLKQVHKKQVWSANKYKDSTTVQCRHLQEGFEKSFIRATKRRKHSLKKWIHKGKQYHPTIKTSFLSRFMFAQLSLSFPLLFATSLPFLFPPPSLLLSFFCSSPSHLF